jgi:hypothetical protein
MPGLGRVAAMEVCAALDRRGLEQPFIEANQPAVI